MALPESRTVTYVPNSLPAVSADNLNEIQDAIATLNESYGRMISDGSDGTVSLVLSGAAPSGTSVSTSGGVSTFTLQRDFFPASLTVGPNAVLATNGYRLLVKGQTWVQTGGKISRDGNAAVNNTGGTGLAEGTLLGSMAGGNGNTASGNTGVSPLGFGFGGAGGQGGGGGGVGGSVSAPPASYGTFRSIPQCLTGYLSALISSTPTLYATVGGGSGGGAGSPDASGTGGGGGGAGGVMVLATDRLILDGSISANGGAGGAATGTNANGGGGGGGGTVILTYGIKSGAGTVTASGGTGGAKTGSGNIGGVGSAGTVFLLPLFARQ